MQYINEIIIIIIYKRYTRYLQLHYWNKPRS